MFRQTTFILFGVSLVAVLMLSACGGDNRRNDPSDAFASNNRDLFVGNWLREQTVYHYLGKDDRVEQPLDSMWFAFELNGICIFTQRIQGAYHKQLYSWTVSDSTLTLTSDILVNTGSFEYSVSDSVLRYTRTLETMAQDSLLGWMYTYRRSEQ